MMEKLTFQDGFFFGCGFFLAGIIAYLAIMVLILAAFFLATVVFGGSLLSFFS